MARIQERDARICELQAATDPEKGDTKALEYRAGDEAEFEPTSLRPDD
jgi:hypothetical protein